MSRPLHWNTYPPTQSNGVRFVVVVTNTSLPVTVYDSRGATTYLPAG